MSSFETLDSDYKSHHGCRGVGRLLWLKAFEAVSVSSTFEDTDQKWKNRSFTFTASHGISNSIVQELSQPPKASTTIYLSGFQSQYRENSPKTASTIANSLFEHCLWYFVRESGAPNIIVKDGLEYINLKDVCSEYMLSSTKKETIKIKNHPFELTHLRLKTGADRQHFIAWCAASRVVDKENISGKISGLHGKIKDDTGEFFYACYVASSFLDMHVRPERIGFDITEISDDLFSETEIGLKEIKGAILSAAKAHLNEHLKANEKSSRERIEKFVSQRAPRYRPILARIESHKLNVDPEISDKELDLLLHKQLADLENTLISEGHEVMNFGSTETPAQYQTRLSNYLSKVDDIKKSDLANYVFHRKIVLDILDQAIKLGPNGKYSKEEAIHEIIMPLKKSSNEILSDNCNLWLIDERLAFHNFLASDKPLSSYPITDNNSTKEPDICALNVFDQPILINDGDRMPPASIVVIEIKRPMRDDMTEGEDKDPIEQALGYLERIRDGDVKTASGREIPDAKTIPGFCYIIGDLTKTMRRRCKIHSLTIASDSQAYFGYNPNYHAYIEVISFSRLLNAARERNRAFFDKLGLPTN